MMKFFVCVHLLLLVVVLREAIAGNLRHLAKPTCGDGQCTGKETCENCPSDCSCSVCGDGTCDETENCSSCTADCGVCTPEPTPEPTVSSAPSARPVRQCGVCKATEHDPLPLGCSADSDCPLSILPQCDAQCLDGSVSCEGQSCPNGNKDCTPNSGPNQSRCNDVLVADTCNLSTCTPTATPTSVPSTSPTNSLQPTAAPSLTPSVNPTISQMPSFIPGTIDTGFQCSSNGDCVTKNCVNGACYASSKCQPLKHDTGSQFAEQQTLLIFVSSGFNGTDPQTWTTEVNKVFSVFANYNMFAPTTTQYTALYSTTLEPSFCYYNCNGIDRLLCCDITKARNIAADCNPFGSAYHVNVQTIVVHNDLKYGGAGYSSNVATTSIHSSGPKVAIHELGHSLFKLADEYPSGWGTSTRANCDGSACTKWSDLIDHSGVQDTYGSVSCIAGCENDAYFVGQVSFMEYLSSPVGAVNERFTCCTYQVITKSMPSYCDIFDFSTDYLLNYCKDNDYQNYGQSNYLPATPSGPEDTGGEYIQLTDSTIVSIDLNDDGTPSWWSAVKGRSGVFPRGKVGGQWASLKDAMDDGQVQVFKVQITFSDEKRASFLLPTDETIKVPPNEESYVGNEDKIHQSASHLDLVLEHPNDHSEINSVSVTRVQTNIFG